MGAAAAAQTCPYLPTEESWKSGKVRPSAFQGPTGARQDSWHDADALTKLKRDLAACVSCVTGGCLATSSMGRRAPVANTELCSSSSRDHLALSMGALRPRRPAGYLSLADVTTLCAQSDVLSVLQPSCVVNNGDPMTNTRGNLRPYWPALPCVDPLKYVHRVGRAGRYGRKAFVLTVLHGNL
ncbi:hypothetical protein WJX82_004766 [Trebouxia sp. C0006]